MARQKTAADRNDRRPNDVAALLAAAAGLCSAAVLIGWTLDIPALFGFGLIKYPTWPLTAVAYLFFSAGLLMHLRGDRRVAAILWIVPFVVMTIAAFEYAFEPAVNIDLAMFGERVTRYPSPHPGRPGFNTVMLFVMLGLMALFASWRTRYSHEVGAMMAVFSMIAFTAGAMLMLFVGLTEPAVSVLAVSVPSAVASALLFGAFLLHNLSSSWIRALAIERGRWRLLSVWIFVIIASPVATSLFELFINRDDLLPPIMAETVVAATNMLIIVAVLFWSGTRVAREQSALLELTSAIDNANIVLTDEDGSITHWSIGCERLYGWSKVEALGQNKYMLLRSRCQSFTGTLPEPSTDGSQQLVEVTRDGRDVSVLERLHRVESPGRPPVIVRDITDVSQRAEDLTRLHESETRLAIATATHEVAVFEWDVASGKISWSPGAEALIGLPTGTITDFESWRAQVEPEDVDQVLQTIAATAAIHSDRFAFRYRLRLAGGDARTIEGSSRILYDDGGEVARTIGAAIDVTGRDRRESALRRREAQLRSIIETAPEPMLIADDAGLIRTFGAAAEELWGYAASNIVGEPLALLFPKDELARNLPLARLVAAGKDARFQQVIPATGRTVSGNRVPLEIRAGLARADGVTLITIFARDLTERLANDERVAELNAELAHVARQTAMSELAADIAHELNQPLSASTNFLAAARMLIERGEGPDRVIENLRMAGEQTLRAGEIIRRLRSFTARGEVMMSRTPIESTIMDAIELVLVGTAQFQIALDIHLDPEAPTVFADRVQVQQVVVNLLRNSAEVLRGMPDGERRIEIASRKCNNEFVEISVADSGPGIPEPILRQLFSRFTTTKREGGGMGIGLSISKRIIEAHGGTLTAENRPGGGAAFRFTLPTSEQGEE